MASFSGKDGTATWASGIELNVTGWEVTETATNPAHATSSTSGWKVRTPGVKNVTGTFSFLQDATTAQPIQAGDAAAALNLFDGNHNYTLTLANIDSVSYSCDIDDGESVGGTVAWSAGDATWAIA